MGYKVLTSKQLQFVEAYVGGKSASDAYRSAYDALNMSATSINKEASRLIAKPQVSALIKELQKESSCLLYTSPSPRDATLSRMPSSA